MPIPVVPANLLSDNNPATPASTADVNSIFTWLQSYVLNPVVPTATKTSAYTATGQDLVKADVSGSAWTLTLPNAPQEGTVVAAQVVKTGNNLTIATQSTDVIDIQGGVSSTTISALDETIILQYRNTTSKWSVLAHSSSISGGGGTSFKNPNALTIVGEWPTFRVVDYWTGYNPSSGSYPATGFCTALSAAYAAAVASGGPATVELPPGRVFGDGPTGLNMQSLHENWIKIKGGPTEVVWNGGLSGLSPGLIKLGSSRLAMYQWLIVEDVHMNDQNVSNTATGATLISGVGSINARGIRVYRCSGKNMIPTSAARGLVHLGCSLTYKQNDSAFNGGMYVLTDMTFEDIDIGAPQPTSVTAAGTVSGAAVTGWAGSSTPVVGMTITGGGFPVSTTVTGGISGSTGNWNFTASGSGTNGSQSLTLNSGTQWGVNGSGGSANGIAVTAFCNTGGGFPDTVGGSPKNPTVLYGLSGAGNMPVNCLIDDINCVRVNHDTGLVGNTVAGDAIQIGGDATLVNRVRLIDCHAWNSGDGSFEVDSARDCVIDGCSSVNPCNTHIYAMNNYGGTSWNQYTFQQDSNEAKWVISNFTGEIAQTIGFGYRGIKIDARLNSRHPNIELKNVKLTSSNAEEAGGVGNINQQDVPITISGPAPRVISLDNVKILQRGFTSTFLRNSGLNTLYGVRLQLIGRTCHLKVRDFHHEVSGTYVTGAFTGCQATAAGLYFYDTTNVKLNVQGVSHGGTVTVNTSGGGNMAAGFPVYKPIQFAAPTIIQEASGTNQFLDGHGGFTFACNYLCDSGAVSDLSASAGVISVNSNGGTEKRFLWLANNSNEVTFGGIGPRQDFAYQTTFTTDTVTTSGEKYGVVGKWADGQVAQSGANSYLDYYVTDNGSNSTLNIDKVVAGTRTNLAQSTLTSRLTSGQTLTVRGQCVGNTLTATAYTNTNPSYTDAAHYVAVSSGSNPLTYTLASGTEQNTFGDQQMGYVGPVIKSPGLTSTITSTQLFGFHVVSGTISNIAAGEHSGWSVLDGIGFDCTVSGSGAGSSTNPFMRVAGGRIGVLDSDWLGLIAGGTTVTEAAFSTTPGNTGDMRPYVDIRRAKWTPANQPAMSTTTAGSSPASFTNTNPYPVMATVWTTGTVSACSKTSLGGSPVQIANSAPFTVRLEPGDALTSLTWASSAPTIVTDPVLT